MPLSGQLHCSQRVPATPPECQGHPESTLAQVSFNEFQATRATSRRWVDSPENPYYLSVSGQACDMASLSLPSKLIKHRKRVQEDFRRTKTHWSPYRRDLYARIRDASCPFLMLCPFQTLAVDLTHPFPLAS